MDKAALDARYRIILTLWASLLGSVTLVTVVVWAITMGVLVPTWSPTLASGAAAPLLLVSPVAMAVGLVYRKRDIPLGSDPGAYLAAYQTRVVVGGALMEGGGLLGLVICLVAGQPGWALGIWAITAVSMGLARPRREEIHRLRAQR